MSVIAEQDTGTLEIRESVASPPIEQEGGSLFDERGLVKIHIIRPGIGRGKGRHLYEADMLRENAHTFEGWKMYVDHLSPEARKASGGLPRGVRDLGGRVVEAEWDDSVPADDRFDQGAVVGYVRPTRQIREYIEDDPELVEASISATATGVRPLNRDGQKVWCVEGINPRGSVDWVTEAGAGGRVAPILEACAEDEDYEARALMESYTDDEFVEFMRADRPHLVEALATAKSDTTAQGDEEVTDITPDALEAALKDSPVLTEAVDRLVEERVNEKLGTKLDEALGERDEIIRAEARAHAHREVQLDRFEVEATRMINESKLPDTWKATVRDQFRLDEAGTPTDGLDQVDDYDDQGAIVKPALEKLREAVETELGRQRDLLAEANPTRVRGQGPASPPEGGETPKREIKETGYGQLLEGAGVDSEKAYPELQG